VRVVCVGSSAHCRRHRGVDEVAERSVEGFRNRYEFGHTELALTFLEPTDRGAIEADCATEAFLRHGRIFARLGHAATESYLVHTCDFRTPTGRASSDAIGINGR
jgi:hypothetical protein